MKWLIACILCFGVVLGCQDNAATPSERPPPDSLPIQVPPGTTSS